MSLDIAKYKFYLHDSGLNPAQEEKVLRAVAVILGGCVDYLFIMHPAQQGSNRLAEFNSQNPGDSLESMKRSIREKYLEAANDSHFDTTDTQGTSTTNSRCLLSRHQFEAGA